MLSQCKNTTQTNPIENQLIYNYMSQIIDDAIDSIPVQNEVYHDGDSQKQSKETEGDDKIRSASSITGAGSDSCIKNLYQKQSFKIIDENEEEIKPQFSKICFLQFLQQKIHFLGDLNQAKHYFIQISSIFNLKASRNLQNILTVKEVDLQILKSILIKCLPFSFDKAVYQLQYRTKSKSPKIKIVQVSGNESDFKLFSKTFIFELWKNNLVCLTIQEIVAYAYSVYTEKLKNEIQLCSTAFKEIQIKKLDNPQKIELWHQLFMKNVKQAQYKLKQWLMSFESYKYSVQQGVFWIQKTIFQSFNVYAFYQKIHSEKLCQFSKRTSEIRQKVTLQQTFKYIQIQMQSQFFDRKLINLITKEIYYPYFSSIQHLNRLSLDLSPLENLKILRQFDWEMSQIYYSYKKQLSKGGRSKQQGIFDMDSQLPITIFCVLMSENPQLCPLIDTLIDYYQFEDNFGTQNRILTALKAGVDFIRKQWNL